MIVFTSIIINVIEKGNVVVYGLGTRTEMGLRRHSAPAPCARAMGDRMKQLSWKPKVIWK